MSDNQTSLYHIAYSATKTGHHLVLAQHLSLAGMSYEFHLIDEGPISVIVRANNSVELLVSNPRGYLVNLLHLLSNIR